MPKRMRWIGIQLYVLLLLLREQPNPLLPWMNTTPPFGKFPCLSGISDWSFNSYNTRHYTSFLTAALLDGLFDSFATLFILKQRDDIDWNIDAGRAQKGDTVGNYMIYTTPTTKVREFRITG